MRVDVDKTMHMRFHGEMVSKLLEIDHEMYAPCITYEKGQKIMYVGTIWNPLSCEIVLGETFFQAIGRLGLHGQHL